MWDNLAIWHHPRPLQCWPKRQTAYCCVRISQGTANPSQNRDSTLWRILPRDKCPNCGGGLAVTCFGLNINELPSCVARDIFRALFVDDLVVCFRGCSLDTIRRHLQQAVNAIQEWATKNGFRFAAHKCKVVHFPATRSWAQRPPLWGLETHFCQWRSQQNSLVCGGTIGHPSCKKHISVLKKKCKEALNLIRVVAHLSGEETETHFWCCTGPPFAPSCTMVALCMAQHQTPIYNWTASITLDWDWHWERPAPAQCPACTQRPMKVLWRNVVKAAHVLLSENSCLH